VKRFPWIPWRWWRRGAQLALLLLFVCLFRRTEYAGADTLPGGENLFFRWDPLAAAAAMLAGRSLIAAFWPALALLLLTLLLGRFFCGWVCPLGTLLDIFQRCVRPLARRTQRRLGGFLHRGDAEHSRKDGRDRSFALRSVRLFCSARYFLLLLCLVGAACAFQLVGFVDPFALLVRGLAFWADPRLFQSSDAVLTWAGQSAVDPVRQFFMKHLLPFRANTYHLAAVSAWLLAMLFLLEFPARRFWCRYLCPLGGLLGLAGRYALLRRVPARVCKDCGTCARNCRMGALDAGSGLAPQACNLCLDCVADCPRAIVKFTVPRAQPAVAALDLSRRGFLAACVAGAALPAVARAAHLSGANPSDPGLLRPPGAGDEKRFLNLCVRCGLCMKVCPTNVLQPAVLESGVEGLFSPRLAPRFVFEQTYCEFNCNLCGQVCPSGAIPRLSLEEKQKAPLGKAYFDHSRCLPWAKNTPCIRCEEVCPLPDKAIKVQKTFKTINERKEELEIQQPRVERDLCIGCGICEANCPLDGPAGIRVRRVDAPDPHTETQSA